MLDYSFVGPIHVHKTTRWIAAIVLSMLSLTTRVSAQTKIMCLGDSITEGFGGWASYRYPLWFDLRSHGFSVSFVGPWTGYHLSSGGPDTNGFYPKYLTEFDRDHAGYSGWRTDQVAAVAVDLATTYKPDVVLVHLGTNDIGQQLAAGVDNADANLRVIISRLRSVRPSVTILLAKIIPRSPSQPSSAFVVPLNLRVQAIANEMNTSASRVIAVDQFTGFDLATMIQIDGLHPNTAGEQRIADVWRQELTALIPNDDSCKINGKSPTANSLVALYTFDDGTLRDVSSSDNKMCRGLGNPTIVPSGYQGSGMFFDGASYLRSDVLIHPSVRPQLTMGAWVRLTNTAVSSTLFSHDNGGFDRTVAIDNRGGGTGWSAFAGSGGGVGGTGVLGFLPAVSAQWQFVATVYDAVNQKVRLYVDGVVRESSGNPGSSACGQNLFIGKEPFCNGSSCAGTPNASCTLSGTVDNVFVMSEALSVTRLDEIRTFGYRRIPTCATIFRQPVCVSACSGRPAIVSIDAGGSGGVFFQWRKDGVPISLGSTGNPSASTAVLEFETVSLLDRGSYDCVVSSGCGEVISNAVSLEVCAGDLDCDGQVNDADFQGFAVAYDLLDCADAAMPASCPADLNRDGFVDDLDFQVFAVAYDVLLCP